MKLISVLAKFGNKANLNIRRKLKVHTPCSYWILNHNKLKEYIFNKNRFSFFPHYTVKVLYNFILDKKYII